MTKPMYWKDIRMSERGNRERTCVRMLLALHPECNENRAPPKSSVYKLFSEVCKDLDDPEWYKNDRADKCVSSCWRRHYLSVKDIAKIDVLKKDVTLALDKSGDTNLRVSWETHKLISSFGTHGESFETILKRMASFMPVITDLRKNVKALVGDEAITVGLYITKKKP